MASRSKQANESTNPTAPKLKDEQREQLLTWMAAGYSNDAIYGLIAKANADTEEAYAALYGSGDSRRADAPELELPFPGGVSAKLMHYYRTRSKTRIEQIRKERHAQAIQSGLAVRAERIARLSRVADELEPLLFERDRNGKRPNINIWRGLLDDIAQEVGDRQKNELPSGNVTVTVRHESKEGGYSEPVSSEFGDYTPPDMGLTGSETTVVIDPDMPVPVIDDKDPPLKKRRLLPEELDDDYDD